MSQHVFVNRILNLKKIKYIGLDMDHTLIRYQTEHFEALVYELVIEALIRTKHYPERLRGLKFSMEGAIRGLVIDSENGNILKLNRYAAIRQCSHGTKRMDFKAQQAFYRSVYVDLNQPNYQVIDTSFSIAFCVLYSQLVDLKDGDEPSLPSYQVLADDVLRMVDKVHGDGSLKQKIKDNLDYFVIKEPNLVQGIERFIRHGKKVFIATNSEYSYTKVLLDYAINPCLSEGRTWEDVFEYVITFTNKPRFFYDDLRFLKIDAKTGAMTNVDGVITPGIYQGGSAAQFSQDLNLNGDDILYIGDHIYGDILQLKKACNWRTALVVDELGAEIKAQRKSAPIQEKILEQMGIKCEREAEHLMYSTARLDEQTSVYDEKIKTLQLEIEALDKQLSVLLKQEGEFYNPTWGRVFRAGAEESYFAQQVERFACIYMEKLVDLFTCSPMTYFRAHRRALPHDDMT
ncbi:MAG: HAD-IG family 5'-nucleotidase [Legionella sp.]|nr:HAD-IG family 5'-nucleotidase [Legionella sp.]